MKILRNIFMMLAAFSLVSCSSDEPQWADPEAHEKTEQLRAQYTPLIVGTWHYEKVGEKQRAFEQLTFNADGTLSGQRKWQSRQVVTIGGQEQYTDWEDVPDENGTFTGTWSLVWERNSKGVGENRITLIADWDDKNNEGYIFFGWLCKVRESKATIRVQRPETSRFEPRIAGLVLTIVASSTNICIIIPSFMSVSPWYWHLFSRLSFGLLPSPL